MTDTFESTKLLAISLHCPLTANSGHLSNVENGEFIVTLPFVDRSKCTNNPVINDIFMLCD